jgi:hypothetical protein
MRISSRSITNSLLLAGLVGVALSAWIYFVYSDRAASNFVPPPDDWCGQSKVLVALGWKLRANALLKVSGAVLVLAMLIQTFFSKFNESQHE